MYDGAKIILGLLVFVLLFTYPVWYDIACGKGSYEPDPKIVTTEKACVAPADYMKAMHMDLLNEWRDKVVRDGLRVYESFDGKKYDMSLSRTCMDCHHNKKDFCDECHNYAGVEPYCWTCHVEPKEM
jgi:hypothetical protein